MIVNENGADVSTSETKQEEEEEEEENFSMGECRERFMGECRQCSFSFPFPLSLSLLRCASIGV